MITEGHNTRTHLTHRSSPVVTVRSLLLSLFAGLFICCSCDSAFAQSATRGRSSSASENTIPPEVLSRIKAQSGRSSNETRHTTEESEQSNSSSSWQARGQNDEVNDSTASREVSTEEALQTRLQRKVAEASVRKNATSNPVAEPALRKTPEPAAPRRSSAGSTHIQQASATFEDTAVTESQNPDTTVASDSAEGTDSSASTNEDNAPFLDLEPERRSSGSGTSPGHSPEVTLATSPTNVIVRAAVWLVIAFCLLILAVLGIRRWQRARGLLPASGSQSRVVETLSVGPGRIVSLIEIGGLRALVAADAGGIKTLVLAPMNFPDELQREMHEPMPAEPIAHGQTIAEL